MKKNATIPLLEQLGQWIHDAWKKYTDLYGTPPHGTLPQTMCLLELGVRRNLENAVNSYKALLAEHKASECFCVPENTDVCEWCIAENLIPRGDIEL
jgi:hypothetical protein